MRSALNRLSSLAKSSPDFMMSFQSDVSKFASAERCKTLTSADSMNGTSSRQYGASARCGVNSTWRVHSFDIIPSSLENLYCMKVSIAAWGMFESWRVEPVCGVAAAADGARLNGGASRGGMREGSQQTKYMSPSRSPEAIVSGTECAAVAENTARD